MITLATCLLLLVTSASAGTLTPLGPPPSTSNPFSVGATNPVTISPSGYITLGDITTPSPAKGRLYFDSTGLGSLYISLDGSSFVPLSTGTDVNGVFSAVVVNANQFTGDGNNTTLALKSSSVTLQGNSFNAASQLVKLGTDASISVTSTSLTGTGVAFSVTAGSATVAGTVFMGYETITNACGAGVSTCSAACSASKQLLSGGCTSLVALINDSPSGNATWSCSSLTVTTLTAYAICARIGN